MPHSSLAPHVAEVLICSPVHLFFYMFVIRSSQTLAKERESFFPKSKGI